jgi:hypothetical protein
VAISQGANPAWRREDLVVWTFAVNFKNRGRRLTLTVNSFGAYSTESSAADPVMMDGVLETAQSGAGEWTMEAAIALDKLSPGGR